ncbi:MAG: helix-turn-helix transcriptional regulator [Lachnospiraceae bacterium]|nr:helix-turn-helix transcriptional regulator [Lachnospiraceae bacterium]
MSEINTHVSSRIRMYRKSRHLTLQQLADQIHKSKSTVSKYETGEITLDIETLAEIAEVLQVGVSQLTDFHSPQPPSADKLSARTGITGMSPFFQARRLYFYFYDGRYQCLKDGIINIRESETTPGQYMAELSISTVSPDGRNREIYYSGKVVYSDMLIRFSFVNQYNALEEDLLYIFNPLEFRDSTDGLLCGISSADLMPCAFKCLVTLTPQEHTKELKNQLLISRKELQRWQKLNMLIVDNRGE